MSNFKKLLVPVILLYAFLSVGSFSEIINKVEVKGNQRISLETIAIFGDIVVGKNYESSDLNLLIKKLYETNFFSNISVEVKNNKLSIVVEENPFVNLIIFKGEKAKKFQEKITEFLIVREKS